MMGYFSSALRADTAPHMVWRLLFVQGNAPRVSIAPPAALAQGSGPAAVRRCFAQQDPVGQSWSMKGERVDIWCCVLCGVVFRQQAERSGMSVDTFGI